MAVTVDIVVEDIDTIIVSYNRIQLYRAATADGAYTLLTTITLVADDIFYEYSDTTGSLASWYRYRFYNSVSTASSDYSNPFQPDGVTRLKMRQTAIGVYKCGLVGAVLTGSTTTVIKTSDYNISSTGWATGRGIGGWLKITSGAIAGETRNIVGLDPATGFITVSPAFSNAPAAADQFEWHWLANPSDWDIAVNQAMQRYYYLDRIPLVGDGVNSRSLAELGWLTNRNQIVGLWYYPTTDYQEVPWGSNGNWWSARQENGRVTLLFDPAPDTSTTIYLEATRPMSKLYTDDSVLPSDANVDLAAALVYDEVLSILCQPTGGAARDVTAWKLARADHQKNIKMLRTQHGPHPRWQQPQLLRRSVVAQPWRAR